MKATAWSNQIWSLDVIKYMCGASATSVEWSMIKRAKGPVSLHGCFLVVAQFPVWKLSDLRAQLLGSYRIRLYVSI